MLLLSVEKTTSEYYMRKRYKLSSKHSVEM